MIAGVLALGAWLGAGAVIAAPPDRNVEGVVLAVEEGDVIVDLGSGTGVTVGDVIELWRPIDLVHPISRRHVKDRYRVGFLKLVQVRDRVAVGVLEGTSTVVPGAGDPVLWRREPETTPPRAPPGPPVPAPAVAAVGPTPAPAPSRSERVAEAPEVTALLESLRDATLVDRIRAYVAFVKKHPESTVSPLLREDAVQYHRLLRAERARAGASNAGSAAGPAPLTRVEHEPPGQALSGRSLALGIYLSQPAGAVLHVRAPGDVGYHSTPMVAAGGGHFRGTVPGQRVRASYLDYFIEAVNREGTASPVVGSAEIPIHVEVATAPDATPPPLQKLTTVSLLTDWADYDRGKDRDRAFQTEGALGMRFADRGVRALRTGFGVYRGKGGSLHELDELGSPPHAVGLTYGWLEGEYAFVPTGSLVLRAVCGLEDAGVTAGAMALVRIGSDLGTNLSLGGEVLGHLGVRGITQLEIRLMPRVPVAVRSEVTTQPAGEGGDLGLRSIVQLGYEVLPRFVIAVRGSYQGRTIHHAGPGGGGAVSYSW